MGIYQKKDNGNYLGDQESHEPIEKVKPIMPIRSGFKGGEIMEGLPGRKDNYPKAAKDIAPSFQNIRDQDPSQGKI